LAARVDRNTHTFALSGDVPQLHEAVYEAMSALIDDPTQVVRAVEDALRAV